MTYTSTLYTLARIADTLRSLGYYHVTRPTLDEIKVSMSGTTLPACVLAEDTGKIIVTDSDDDWITGEVRRVVYMYTGRY